MNDSNAQVCQATSPEFSITCIRTPDTFVLNPPGIGELAVVSCSLVLKTLGRQEQCVDNEASAWHKDK